MECDKHKNRVVLHAFSEGKCQVCGEKIVTPHIPCDLVCYKCSDIYNLCVICGEKIEDDGEK